MSNWWANKLGTPQAPVQRPAYQQPPQQQQYAPQQGYVPPQPIMNPELQGHVIPESAYNSSKCPNCSSGNYGKSSPEAKARCYDCGYPIQQSGSGLGRGISMPGASGGGPVTPAKQISTANNFNPGTIVDRIG